MEIFLQSRSKRNPFLNMVYLIELRLILILANCQEGKNSQSPKTFLPFIASIHHRFLHEPLRSTSVLKRATPSVPSQRPRQVSCHKGRNLFSITETKIIAARGWALDPFWKTSTWTISRRTPTKRSPSPSTTTATTLSLASTSKTVRGMAARATWKARSSLYCKTHDSQK